MKKIIISTILAILLLGSVIALTGKTNNLSLVSKLSSSEKLSLDNLGLNNIVIGAVDDSGCFTITKQTLNNTTIISSAINKQICIELTNNGTALTDAQIIEERDIQIETTLKKIVEVSNSRNKVKTTKIEEGTLTIK